MKTAAITILSLTCAAVSFSTQANADAVKVLDQVAIAPVSLSAGSTYEGSSSDPSRQQVQTFTAGYTGALAEIDRQITGAGSYTLSVFDGDYISGGATFLGSYAGVAASPTAGGLSSFSLPGSLSVKAGQTYSLLTTGCSGVIASIIGYVDLSGTEHPINYAGGQSAVEYTPGIFTPTASARSFQTWVDTDNSVSSPLQATATDGTSSFVFDANAGQTIYIDPAASAGYQFEVGENDPKIDGISFVTPSTSPYRIYSLSGALLGSVSAGQEFEFASPVSVFDVYNSGVATNSNFVSGLTFGSAGAVHLEQAVLSAVPEPSTWAMLIIGFGGIGGVMRRAHRKSEEKFTRKVRSLATA